MKHKLSHAFTPLAAAMIAADPPLDLISYAAAERGYPRDLTEVLVHFHAEPVIWTTGTRFEACSRAGWRAETAAADGATVDAYLAARPEWEKRGGIWYNHVAKARVKDDELVILINLNTLDLNAPEETPCNPNPQPNSCPWA